MPELLEVKLADSPGGVGTLLELGWEPSFQDPQNDIGTGTLNLQLDDPAIDDVEVETTYLQWFVDGVHRYTSRVETVKTVNVDRGEEAGQLKQIWGRGIVSELEKAHVRPELGFEEKPYSTSRVFGFANPYFDDSSWDNAYHQFQQYENLGPPENLYGLPEDWPHPFDYWIWSQPYDPPNEVDPATSYFRKEFTLSGSVTARIVVAGDNKFKAYIDGIEILSYLINGNDGWMRLSDIDVDMTDGPHVLAMVVENIPGPSNYAALIAGIWENAGPSGLGDHIVTSDYSWVMVHDPATPPGFSVDQVVGILLDEAQGDGFLTDWTLDVHGSFPVLPEIAVQVGADFLSVMRQFAEAYLDFDADHDGKVLNIWPKGERGGTPPVEYVIGENVTELSRAQQGRIRNVAHVEYDAGHILVEDDTLDGYETSIDRYGPACEFLSLKNLESRASVESYLEQWFALNAWPMYSVVLGIEPYGANLPYADYGKGDHIVVDGEELTVQSFTARCDDVGFVQWAVEVATREQVKTVDLERWLKSQALGAADGKSLTASPNNPGVSGAVRQRFPSTMRVAPFSFIGAISASPPANLSGSPALDRPFRLTGMILGSHGDGTDDTAVKFRKNGVDITGGFAVLGATDFQVRSSFVDDLVPGDSLEAECYLSGGHTGVVATPRGYYV